MTTTSLGRTFSGRKIHLATLPVGPLPLGSRIAAHCSGRTLVAPSGYVDMRFDKFCPKCFSADDVDIARAICTFVRWGRSASSGLLSYKIAKLACRIGVDTKPERD
jgi:hypothetical protein